MCLDDTFYFCYLVTTNKDRLWYEITQRPLTNFFYILMLISQLDLATYLNH